MWSAPSKTDILHLDARFFGKKSGGANVALVNERLGLPPVEDKEVVRVILDKVKTLSIKLKRDLNDEEYTEIYHEVLG